jgi:predicted dinucleotide-binding enzyme
MRARTVKEKTMKPRIAVIGKGNVGGALTRGLERAGYSVRAIGNDAAAVRDAGAWGEVIILAVPYGAIEDAVRELGDGIHGKVLVDASNALTPDYQLAVGFTTSGAEELQKRVPAAKVVKAFNTVFAQHMDTGTVKGTQLSLLVAGDDAAAKASVSTLGRDLGFDAVDAGPLTNARWLESLGYLNIQLGYMLKMGPEIGFVLVH